MPKLSLKLLLSFAAAIAAGSMLHFVYKGFPNAVTAIIAPVNESIWEHMKLLFWPYLATGLLLYRGNERDGRTSMLLSLLIICALMPAAGYGYYIMLGGINEAFGPILYVLLMAVGSILPVRLRRFPLSRVGHWVRLAVTALGVAIVLFTFLPPDHVLFADLSRTNTWEVIL